MVVSDSGLGLGRDWAFNSMARPSTPKIASASTLSSPGQSSAIAFVEEPARWEEEDEALQSGGLEKLLGQLDAHESSSQFGPFPCGL